MEEKIQPGWSGALVDLDVNRKVAGLGLTIHCVSLIDVHYSTSSIRFIWEKLATYPRVPCKEEGH